MADAVVVRDVHVRLTAGDRRQPFLGATGDVVEQHDHRARVDAGRPQQLVAVLLGSAERAFVGQDPGIRSVRLEAEASEEAALRALAFRAGHSVALLIHVDRGLRILAQRAVRPPRGQRPSRTPIPVVRPVTCFLDRHIEADDVGRVGRDQARPHLRVDDVVGRSDDLREVTDARRLVTQGAERSEIRQGTLGVTARRLRLWGRPHRTIALVRTATEASVTRRRGATRNFHGGSGVLAATIPA